MTDFLGSWLRAVLPLAVAGGAAAAGFWLAVHSTQVFRWRWSLTAFELRLPRTATVEEVSHWVGTLRAILRERHWWSLLPRWPLCLETTATPSGIRHVVVVPHRLHADVVSTLTAVLPGARLTELAHYLDTQWRIRFQVAAEARLKSTGELLALDRSEDTHRHLLAALQPLEAGEVVRVQWLLAGALAPPWALDPHTNPQMIPAYLKHTDPVLVAVCRVAVSSRRGHRRATALYGRVWAALRGMNTPRARLTRRSALPSVAVAVRVVMRTLPRGRWPMVMTAREVGGLLGLITGQASLPGVPTRVSRALPPSPSMPTTGLVIAASNYPSVRTPLCLARADRLRHLWMLGPPGVGKSTLLANLASYDIHSGDGLIVIDARGDLVADVLDRIPAHRADDVIVIDPTSGDHVIGINPLRAGPAEQAAGFVYHVLHAVYASAWGPRTADIVRATLLTLTATKARNGQAFTMIDIPELLTNAGFRRLVTAQPLPPQLAGFWRWYEALSTPQQLNMISPVLNKLRTFTLSTPLRAFLGQSDGINFHDALTHKRIVLVALKKGLLGAETSSLIGSLVMASVWQATLRRANTPTTRRRPFWLYIDEFQDIVKLPIDLADMLAQARGLGLGLTLAHQYLAQLTPELKNAVLGTTRSQIMFQLGHHDAKELAASFAPLTAEDLANLATYEVALRPCVSGATLPPVTGSTYPMPKPTTDGTALAQASTRRYGSPTTEVDQQITARTTTSPARGRRGNRIPTGEQS
jgi:hypothetical protein